MVKTADFDKEKYWERRNNQKDILQFPKDTLSKKKPKVIGTEPAPLRGQSIDWKSHEATVESNEDSRAARRRRARKAPHWSTRGKVEKKYRAPLGTRG